MNTPITLEYINELIKNEKYAEAYYILKKNKRIKGRAKLLAHFSVIYDTIVEKLYFSDESYVIGNQLVNCERDYDFLFDDVDFEREYDADGNILSECCYDREEKFYASDSKMKAVGVGFLRYKKVFEYDKNGDNVRIIKFEGNGDICWVERFEYDENGNVVYEKAYDANGVLKYTREYDEHENPKLYLRYDKSGKVILERIYVYLYDENGNVLFETEYENGAKAFECESTNPKVIYYPERGLC